MTAIVHHHGAIERPGNGQSPVGDLFAQVIGDEHHREIQLNAEALRVFVGEHVVSGGADH